ncbi:MAG: hypothetical protein ABJO86_00575 [Lentilitoribacter sp.]
MRAVVVMPSEEDLDFLFKVLDHRFSNRFSIGVKFFRHPVTEKIDIGHHEIGLVAQKFSFLSRTSILPTPPCDLVLSVGITVGNNSGGKNMIYQIQSIFQQGSEVEKAGVWYNSRDDLFYEIIRLLEEAIEYADKGDELVEVNHSSMPKRADLNAHSKRLLYAADALSTLRSNEAAEHIEELRYVAGELQKLDASDVEGEVDASTLQKLTKQLFSVLVEISKAIKNDPVARITFAGAFAACLPVTGMSAVIAMAFVNASLQSTEALEKIIDKFPKFGG